MKTRCKFVVQSVTQHGYQNMPTDRKPMETVKLAAVYDGGGAAAAENKSFSEATPTGELQITVSNQDVIGTFRPGSAYYLDLIPVE